MKKAFTYIAGETMIANESGVNFDNFDRIGNQSLTQAKQNCYE